jgi:hypothetical protein
VIVFDIETGPQPEDRLRELCPPWEAPPHPGKFDAAAVKLGNLKDAVKIAEKIGAAQAAHEAARESAEESRRTRASLAQLSEQAAGTKATVEAVRAEVARTSGQVDRLVDHLLRREPGR